MIKYILKKTVYGFLVLLGVVLIVFFLFKFMPDPARMTMGQRADISSIEAIRKEEYLDELLLKQFQYYLRDISPFSVHENTPESRQKYNYIPLFSLGDNRVWVIKKPYLRRSYQNKRLVSEIISQALPTTVILGFTAITLASILGILFGCVAAVKQHRFWDQFIQVFAILGYSQPPYFSGVILALVFGYYLAPLTGLNSSGGLFALDDYGNEIIIWKNLILPALALGIRPVAIIMQLTRSAMLDVLSQDYIRTAYAKGLNFSAILIKHALRNALNPVITVISGWFAAILSGAFFIEIIFDFKGLGYETIKALNNLDFPVAMGCVLFTATVFVLINILVDIMYGWLDPRITYH